MQESVSVVMSSKSIASSFTLTQNGVDKWSFTPGNNAFFCLNE